MTTAFRRRALMLLLLSGCLLLVPGASQGQASPVVLFTYQSPWVNNDLSSYCQVKLTVTLVPTPDPANSAPYLYHWDYFVTNSNYRTPSSNDLCGFAVVYASSVTEATNPTGPGPAQWQDSHYYPAPKAAEWDLPNGQGLAPISTAGRQGTGHLEFDTSPRTISPGTGVGWSFDSSNPDYVLLGNTFVPGPLPNRPVVLIPGIGASELVDPGNNDKLIWPYAVTIHPFAAPVSDLQFDQYGNPITTTPVSARLQADAIYSRISDYTSLRNALTSAGRQVIDFPYDFRYPVSYNATQLATFLRTNSILRAGQQVDLVAHSMGGLVAKQYLDAYPADGRVATLVMVGTPHLGAPKALKVLRYGDDMDFSLLVKDDLVKRAAHNMPGVYDLLPSRAYFGADGGQAYYSDQTGTFTDFTQMIRTLKTDPERLAPRLTHKDPPPTNTLAPSLVTSEVMVFHDSLDSWVAPPAVQTYMIAGQKVATLSSIEEDSHKSKPIFTLGLSGDGTVPLLSARATDADAIYLADLSKTGMNAEHTTMLSNADLQKQVIGLLNVGPGIYGDNLTELPSGPASPRAAQERARRYEERRMQLGARQPSRTPLAALWQLWRAPAPNATSRPVAYRGS